MGQNNQRTQINDKSSSVDSDGGMIVSGSGAKLAFETNSVVDSRTDNSIVDNRTFSDSSTNDNSVKLTDARNYADNSVVNISSLDSGLALTSINAATDLAALGLAAQSQLTTQTIEGTRAYAETFGAIAGNLADQSIKSNASLVQDYKQLAEGSQTSMRDALAVALNSDQLAGKAADSTAPATKVGWGLAAGVALALLLFSRS